MERYMKKIRNRFIFIFAGVCIVIFTMFLPHIYFKKMDEKNYQTRKYMEQITFALDTDVRNIEAVRELHRLLGSPFQIDVYEAGELVTEKKSFSKNNHLKNEAQGLKTVRKKVEKDILILSYDEKFRKAVQVIYQPENYNRIEYIKSLCTKKGEQKIEKEMRQFIEYLGMNVIEDWTFFSDWSDFTEDGNSEYNYQKIREEDISDNFKWELQSSRCKLRLVAKPEKTGVRYYFEINYY